MWRHPTFLAALVVLTAAGCRTVPQEALPAPSTVTVMPAADAPPEPAAARPVPTTTTVFTTTTSLPDSITYEVQPGDTFYAVAAKFGISNELLLQLNPLRDPGRLVVGQLLVVPGPNSPVGQQTGAAGTGTTVTASTLPAATKNG